MSNKLMRHLDLFTGIGGFALAARELGGIETTQLVEIEPACRRRLNKNFSGVPIHGDIATFTPDQHYDIITAGYPCFIAGTLVLTKSGYKAIEEIKVGELVLTHRGRWKPVTKLMSKNDAALREIKAMGVHSLVTTDEHPFYSRERIKKWNNTERKYEFSFTDPAWEKAGSLTGNHYVCQILPEVTPDNMSPAFWRLVGLYLADGWRQKRLNRERGGRVVICANKKQTSFVESIISSAGFNYYKCEERTVFKYHITNNEFYEFLADFGHKAEGKQIPGWALGLDAEKAQSLVGGLLFGDGWTNKKGHARLTTISQKLAYSAALLMQRAFDGIATVSFCAPPKTTKIEGRTVNQKPQYTVQMTFNNNENKAWTEGDYGWKRIRKNIRRDGRQTVFNLSVQDDNSYVANGAVVHNCQDISPASKTRSGLQGDRSGLFYECIRLLRSIRPDYLILENSSALLTHRGGRDMATILWELSESGYDAQWSTISACSVGASHMRERLFILAYPNSFNAEGLAFQQEFARSLQRINHQPRPKLWGSEPPDPRMANGIPSRMERMKMIGNAVVPEVARIPLTIALAMHQAREAIAP